jgi:hypothetical protein
VTFRLRQWELQQARSHSTPATVTGVGNSETKYISRHSMTAASNVRGNLVVCSVLVFGAAHIAAAPSAGFSVPSVVLRGFRSPPQVCTAVVGGELTDDINFLIPTTKE